MMNLALKKVVRVSVCVALILLATTARTFSQDINIHANITDSKNKPVAYAHIYVSDSVSNIFLGTVSDFEGSFQILIPEKYSSSNLSISCVGYELFSTPLPSVLGMRTFVLEESEKLLSTVIFKDVTAEEIVNKGIENLPGNYMNSEFLNQYFNWKGLQMDSSVVDFQERYLTIEEVFSDHRGTRNILTDSIDHSKSSNRSSVADIIYGLSDNLYFDLIKSGSTVFNKSNFSEWEFRYLDTVDSTSTKDVVILGNRIGKKGFNELTFYIDIEKFAFKRIDFSYEWDAGILNKKVNDTLYYEINKIAGLFLYQKTAKKYNLKYQFLQVEYSFQYRSVAWNHSNKKFPGVYVEEMNVLCSTERKEAVKKNSPCNLKPAVVNTSVYNLLRR